MRRDWLAQCKGRHFEPEIIILCVRRYLRYALSLRNLEEIMAERNVRCGSRYHLEAVKKSASRFSGKGRS